MLSTAVPAMGRPPAGGWCHVDATERERSWTGCGPGAASGGWRDGGTPGAPGEGQGRGRLEGPVRQEVAGRLEVGRVLRGRQGPRQGRDNRDGEREETLRRHLRQKRLPQDGL